MPFSQVLVVETQVALASADVDLLTHESAGFAVGTVAPHSNQTRTSGSVGRGQGRASRSRRSQGGRCIGAHGGGVAKPPPAGETKIRVEGIAVAAARADQCRTRTRRVGDGCAAALAEGRTICNHATTLKAGQHRESVLEAIPSLARRG